MYFYGAYFCYQQIDHPFFCGLQAHPEFCTRPLNPSPPYLGFIAAACGVLAEQIIVQKSYKAPHPESHLVGVGILEPEVEA